MKLAFSCLLLLIFAANASAKLITISYEPGEKARASKIRNYFISDYAIPVKLILILQREDCNVDREKYFELCIDKKKALNIVSAKDILLIRKSILSFSNQREVRNEF
jgi:hypothetical protein